MEIKDFIHLYLGCEMQAKGGDTYTLQGVFANGTIQLAQCSYKDDCFDFKPILRPLSDITDEEIKEIHPLGSVEIMRSVYSEVGSYVESNISIFDFIGDVRLLLIKHFDLFGLIERGLAIDKTKL